MNNKERYKEVFNKIEASEYKTIEELSAKRNKPIRASKRLVLVFCCFAVFLLGTTTANAATGGSIGDYFENLLGGENAVSEIVWDNGDKQYCIEVNMKESTVGIYDENNHRIKDLTKEESDHIEFEKNNQSCTLNGKRYAVLLICGVNENTGECISRVQLYDPSDFNKAQKNFDPNIVFQDDQLTIFCPYIDVQTTTEK